VATPWKGWTNLSASWLQYKRSSLLVGLHVLPANERVTDGARSRNLLLSHYPNNRGSLRVPFTTLEF
jgi:hypothetical protein